MQELTNAPQPEQQPESAMSLIMTLNPQVATQKLQGISNFQSLVNSQLVSDQDYGVIPGTNKPTLLKPGAEKILMILGLQSQYTVTDKVEDWDNGFFAYTVRATLVHDGQVITQGLGAANTKENRYQLKEYDENQHKRVWDGKTYQDPYTLQNTVLKMAKKRAQVDATLTVGSLSNIFTQDMEDLKGFAKEETVHEAATGNPADFKLTFGKHRGETFGQLGATKDGYEYIEWLSKAAQKPDVKQMAERFLKQGATTDQQSKQPAPAAQPQQAAPGMSQTGTPAGVSDEDLNSLFANQGGQPDLPF